MSARQFEEMIRHAREAKGDLSPEAIDRIGELLQESLNQYVDERNLQLAQDWDVLPRTLEHLQRALAALIASRWTFDSDDELAPFDDEEGAFQWLSGNGQNEDAGEPGPFFEDSSRWDERTLWSLIADGNRRLGDLVAFEKGLWKHHWSRPVRTPSRLPWPVQKLIFDLCQIWHDHVSPRLGLPRRDPNPDNPLLRFVDTGLSLALAEGRPAKDTVLNVISKFIRPAILQRAADDGSPMRVDLQDDENPFGRVDFGDEEDSFKSPR
ncbi:MAG: hypothetical protein AB7O56_03465 [Bauldia sp.]